MLLINSLIKWLSQEKSIVERILWLDSDNYMAFVINIELNKFPYYRNLKDIYAGLKDGFITIVEEDPYARIIEEQEVPDKHKEMREEAWNMIKDIVTVAPEVFINKERRKLMLKVSKQYKVSENTVAKYLKRYWMRGKIKNALLPDFYLCGAGGEERKVNDVKRGRPRKNAEVLGNGINVDEEVKKIFKVAINKFYYTTAKNSLKAAYQLMLKEFFSSDIKIKDNVEVPILKPYSELPSFGQFKYWFLKERDFKKEIKSRKSLKKYEQNHRAILGSSTTEALGPGSIYQIDATIADVYLVSRFNRNWIIGKPILYTVMDVFFRCVVGVYVGLEGPSWAGSMMALSNALSKKKDFCAEYGIEIEEGEWDIHYLPESILADRGEIISRNAEELTNNLHITVKNTGSYRSDFKGIIEQHFNVINSNTKSLLPATVDPNVRERGDRDFKLDAKLDLSQFMEVIIRCILYHNNHHYLSNYVRE